MNNYDKLNYFVASGNKSQADELFHRMILDTANKIYEAMESDDDLEDVDFIGGDAADDLIADISTDEDEQEMRNMEETAVNKPVTNKPYKSDAVSNRAKLTPAPQPTNKQENDVNNLTPFPKTN